MLPRQTRLPIKVVIPRDSDLRQKPAGGGPRKVFGEVGREQRSALRQQVAEVRKYFGASLRDQGLPAVARVVLKTEAIAKSHRPTGLLSPNTCPVIGGEAFGHLLVSVKSEGLERLDDAIAEGDSTSTIADISTIERIEPYKASDALRGFPQADRLRRVGLREPLAVKLRVFQHLKPKYNKELLNALHSLTRDLQIDGLTALRYQPLVLIYKAQIANGRQLSSLASFVGTQSLQPMPKYRLLAQYLPKGQQTARSFPPPDGDRDYPVVGMLDSGTDPDNMQLRAWLAGRDEADVPRPIQDNTHGTFVAGLIANARKLNHDDPRFPDAPAKILDVVALPDDRTGINEDELLDTIKRAVRQHPEVRVWNLSASSLGHLCVDHAFSDFAMALDQLQSEHNITFVVCAGNYDTPPLRGWPPEQLQEADRLFAPADSVHAVTVGSVAHADHPRTRVRAGEPSPFTRRGPGAAHVPKPDVTHYGGNCDENLDCSQVGVLSLHPDAQIAEAIGTSFSTPLVSAMLANIMHGVSEPISPELARALLIHSAVLRSGPITAESLRYRGFGTPMEVPEILTCSPWQATLVFEPELPPHKKVFAKADFPIPRCLRTADGNISGEIVMTLVYAPPVNPRAGAEYCQVNVDVSLGTLAASGAHRMQVPLEPSDISQMYEEHLVKYGFKWSPVKVYRRTLHRVSGSRWEILMKLLCREGFEIQTPQRVALLVTIQDPSHKLPVYDEVVHAMSAAGWITQDLRVSPRVQVRAATQ